MIMHFFLFFQLFFIYVFASFSQIFSTDIEVTSRILDIGNPPVSLNLGGYFISVWSLHSSDEADYGIFGQIYDPKSSQYSDSFKISTSTNYSQGHPSVSLLNDGTS